MGSATPIPRQTPKPNNRLIGYLLGRVKITIFFVVLVLIVYILKWAMGEK